MQTETEVQLEVQKYYDKETQQFLQSTWYILAEKIFKQIIEITNLDKKREDALRSVVMRPNDFEIQIENYTIE